MTYNSCKILSPVGSMDVLEAAVKSGADFVYLSGKKYGAREFADNFSYDELKEAIGYCHNHNVGVFVTVNVSILEKEIVDVMDYVYFLYISGVDGVIVQDIGLAGIIHEYIPELCLHASTQMTIYDYSFVKWLCENGFSSANLSREVPLERIRGIVSRLEKFGHDINIEVFGHGALCYCYSGACLMSSFLGGRSGNRGLCAQPCRMRYSLKDYFNTPLADDSYLLSTKDLCTYNHVDEFVDAGVNCIKIEGRMKKAEYVSATTYCYRKALDGDINRENYQLLNLAFNRGLTEGYILGRSPGDVVGRLRSGSTGYPIGRVIRVRDDDVVIKFTNKKYPVKLVNGDGLKFEYDGESCGMYVNRIFSQNRNKVVIGKKRDIIIEKDSMVYITYSKYLKDKTSSIIHEENIHKTPIYLEININNNMEIEVKASCDLLEKNVFITGEEKLQKAKNKPLTKENLSKQLQKTGNTNYTIKQITYKNFPENTFMAISSINNLRRQLIQKIHHQIIQKQLPTKEEKTLTKNKIKTFKEKHYQQKAKPKAGENWNVYIDRTEQTKTIKKYEYINTVYYDGSYNHNTIKEYTENITDELIKIKQELPEKELVWILPQILLDEDLPHIAEIILKLETENINIKIQTDNIGVAQNLQAEKYSNHMNIYNNYTIKQLSKLNYTRVMISNEISYDDIKKLNNTYCQLEYTLFGKIQLMLTEDNFEDKIRDELENIYYLLDKRENRFMIKKDCYNHSHIFDYRTLNLDKKLGQLRQTNINNFTIDLRFFNNTDTDTVLEHYDNLIKNREIKKLELTQKQTFFEGNIEKGVYNK